MERLVKEINEETDNLEYYDYYTDENKGVVDLSEAIDKLSQLEDLMEKYHCDDVEHLKQKLELDLIHQDELFKARNKVMSLENKLRNAIVPKFNVGQEVWFVDCGKIKSDHIITIKITDKGIIYFTKYHNYNENLFATQEEAEKKLEELKNE